MDQKYSTEELTLSSCGIQHASVFGECDDQMRVIPDQMPEVVHLPVGIAMNTFPMVRGKSIHGMVKPVLLIRRFNIRL